MSPFNIRDLAAARDCGEITPLQHAIIIKLEELAEPGTRTVRDFSSERLLESFRIDFRFLGNVALPSTRTIQRAMDGLEESGWLTSKHIQGSQRPYPVVLCEPKSGLGLIRASKFGGNKTENRDGDVSVTVTVRENPDSDGDESHLRPNKNNEVAENWSQALSVTDSPDFDGARDGEVSEGGVGGWRGGKSPSNAGRAQGSAEATSHPPKTAPSGNGGCDSHDEEKSKSSGPKTSGRKSNNLEPLNNAVRALGEITDAAGLGSPSLTEGERHNLAAMIKETEPWIAAPGSTFHFDKSNWELDFLEDTPTRVEPWQVVALHFAHWVATKNESLLEFKHLKHLFAAFFRQRDEVATSWAREIRLLKIAAGIKWRKTKMLDANEVTAVRLGDGWHEGVTDFDFYGDGQSEIITMAGASWRETNGCKFSCPLTSILALREGTPPPVDELPPIADSRIGRPDDKLQRAVRWLEHALQDGPRPRSELVKAAKDEEHISPEMLYEAKTRLKVTMEKAGPGRNAVTMWSLPGVPVYSAPVDESESAAARILGQKMLGCTPNGSAPAPVTAKAA